MFFKTGSQIVMPFFEKVRQGAASVFGAKKPKPRGRSKAPLIFIDTIGPVHFIRRKGARYIKISVEPFKGLRVTVPYGVAFKDAERFVQEKRDWIKKQTAWVGVIERDHAEGLRTAVPLDQTLARAELINRVQELAARCELSYRTVTIRNQRTRWGSCSHNNNINLNVKLVRLPAELRDYVIMHELVHTKVKDHSPVFWAALDKFVGEAKALDRQLRKYHTWVL